MGTKFEGKRYGELTNINFETPTHIWKELDHIASQHRIAKTCILNSLVSALVTGDIKIAGLPMKPKSRGVFFLDNNDNLNDVLKVTFTDRYGQLINANPIPEK